MAIAYLPVSSHRFKRSPFFACNDRPDTQYGIYNNRLYPISSGYDEHAHYQHLRNFCCLYDVPETPLLITGPDRYDFLNQLFTRDIRKIKIGRAGYALACNHEGGVVMDGVLMRPNEEQLIYVQANGDFLNWANAQALDFEVTIQDFDSWVLQVQGPTALEVLETVTGIEAESLPYYAVTEATILGDSFYISRTGWTGERGFEIYSKGADFDGVALWQHLLEQGQRANLIASDISSMHIRRLEAGILDYGTDIDQSTNPFEIGFGHFVDFKKPNFNGKSALADTDHRSPRLLGLKSPDVAPVRGDTLQDAAGHTVGSVTAGAWSPTLDCGIALVRLDRGRSHEQTVTLINKSGQHAAAICALPFIDPEKRLPR
jgi:aminomethyltransferase